ncbi:MAG: glycosyltransferase family 4 protein [Bacteroidetes bacterium]|nr:glycosyltransferase family 4 protein [Bacteroidota bacterium]
MKILMLTQWFQPEKFYKGLSFARELAKRGHTVTVLTGFPNYPGGKVFPGYKITLLKKELMEEIQVVRVPLYPNHSSSKIGRIANYLSFALSAAILGPFVVKRPDLIYVYHPPATSGMAGVVLRKIFRIPMVYDIQDLWPDTLSATGMVNNKRILSIVDKFCKIIYKGTSHIVVLSPGFKTRLVERGVPSGKIDVIYNWSGAETIVNIPNQSDASVESVFSNKFNIVFAGNLGKAQGLDNVLSAAVILMKSHPQIQFIMIGSGIDEDRLKNEADRMQLNNIIFLPSRDPEEMEIIYKHSDVLLVHLKDDPLFSITIPGKTQKSLLVGKPILMSVRGDAADLVKQANAGICAEPGNPEALAEAAKTLYEMTPAQRQQLGSNGRKFYDNELEMSKGIDKFNSLFIRLNEEAKN